MTDTNIGRQSGEAEAMSERAGQAARQASGLAGKAASALASEAQSRASGLMQQQMKAGADYVHMVSETAHTAARELEDKAPELARMVHDVADRADGFADDLRKRDVEEMLDAAWDFASRNPRMFLGGAVAMGFLLARLAKSSAERSGASRRYEPSHGGSSFRTRANVSPRSAGSGVSPGASSSGVTGSPTGAASSATPSSSTSTAGGTSYAG